MEQVIQVFQFVMNLSSQVLTLFMSNWITSIFIFGCIILLVLNLVFVNKDE